LVVAPDLNHILALLEQGLALEAFEQVASHRKVPFSLHACVKHISREPALLLLLGVLNPH
jgi:hypothetical protein